MKNHLSENISKTVALLKELKPACVLTGAGISVESGVPPFRGKGGLWEKIDPFEYAHIDTFLKNPTKVWNVLLKEMKTTLDRAKPNKAHETLAELENMGLIKTIITQNIDGLHQAAGSKDVIEFHGNFAFLKCVKCDKICRLSDVSLVSIPPLCKCGGNFRPDCVFFGEAIPAEALKRSSEAAASCKLMIVIGTSATVHPASSIPYIAKESGAVVIEINTDTTPLTSEISDIFLQGRASAVMTEIFKSFKPE